MRPVLPLFIFIDACGWEILLRNPFAEDLAPLRRRLRSVFGYSSACVPSIVSGGWPVRHRHWNYFVYDPRNSPFRRLRVLRWLPKIVTSRRRFRRLLSRGLKSALGFKGYFDLYNMPFGDIGLFDFTEKGSPLRPGGMNRGKNIFDYLEEEEIPYHVSDPENGERENLEALRSDIEKGGIDFGFLYWPGLDGLLHQVGNDSERVGQKLREYEEWLRPLVQLAGSHYRDVRLYLFSDHGMANCDRLLDLQGRMKQARCVAPRDYVAAYDSTMARFWFLREGAREEVVRVLETVNEGRIVPDPELAELGVGFPDRYFGELVFLVQEGVLIVPSHMGERPIRAMHGYHPDDPQSYAVLATNQGEIAAEVEAIPHIYSLMVEQAQAAAKANDRGLRRHGERVRAAAREL